MAALARPSGQCTCHNTGRNKGSNVADEKKGVPAVSPKSKRLQKLGPGEKADTGGDWYDRMRGNYAKNPPPSEDSPFYPMGFGK